jgi:hypothetical protein
LRFNLYSAVELNRIRGIIVKNEDQAEAEVISVSRYEWDAHKSAKNIQKHAVTFEEAVTAFDDPMFVTVVDAEHSTDEERYITIGLLKQAAY